MTRWIVTSLLLTTATASALAYVGLVRTDLLMEKIPIHWDIHMEPDGWTQREDFVWHLLAFPGIMLVMIGLMALLPWLSPKNFEIDRFANTFGFVMTTLVVFFGYLGALVLWAGMQENPPYWGKCFIAGFFALFAVMGNVMGKVQRNFWMGIRTPWTLASEPVWNRTHRVAAWLWVIAGIGGGAAVLLGAPFWIGLIVIIVAALWPVIYSLMLYKALEREGKL
jgi:uncharacterized membrane protein